MIGRTPIGFERNGKDWLQQLGGSPTQPDL
jgi:hypothetical protein